MKDHSVDSYDNKVNSPSEIVETNTNNQQVGDATQMSDKTSEEKVNFGKYTDIAKKYWWIIAISVVCCVGLAALYIKIKSPVYLANAMVMMNQNDDDEASTMANSALGSLMSSFSLGSTSVNIEDEVYRMTSHSQFKQVVKDLELNSLYWSRDSYFKPKVSYFGKTPIHITMPESVLDTLSVLTKFSISIPASGTPLHVSVSQDGKSILDTEIKKMPCTIETPYGTFGLAFTSFYKPGKALNLQAAVMGYEDAIDNLRQDLYIGQTSRKANAVTLNVEDMDKERGKAILNHLIATYNQNGIEDKNQQTLQSAKFIEDRLVKIYRELSSSEADIEQYKRKNNIVDPEAEADYAYKLRGSVEEKSLDLQAKAAILKMLRDYLANPAHKYSLAPFAEDLPDVPIQKYNELVLDRMRLESQIKGSDNAQLNSLTAQIDAVRANLIASLDKNIQGANMAIADINRQKSTSNARLNDAPTFERELQELYRDQNIKNRIYGFLLQKREENELKLSKNVPKAVIIDEAYITKEPVKPKKGLILGGAFIASIAIGYVIALLLQKISIKKEAKKALLKED